MFGYYNPPFEGMMLKLTSSAIDLVIGSLIVYQLILIGVLGLDQFEFAALILPLVVITILFAMFLHLYKRSIHFVPLLDCPSHDEQQFIALDLDHVEDGELVYQDPALLPLSPLKKVATGVHISNKDSSALNDSIPA